MKFCHVSDSHGYFPDLRGDFDFVVHSGDLFPNSNNGRYINKSRDKKQREIEFQRSWIRRKSDTIHKWLRSKPLLYCAGNHDFFNPCDLLNELGVETIDLTNKSVEYAGYRWYGFPYVNFLVGEWNWELDKNELWQKTQWMMNKISGDTDILVAHDPIYGILDESWGEHIGNNFIQDALTYRETAIKLYLHGHCHESPGFIRMEELDLSVSNAAYAPRIIEKVDDSWEEVKA